MRERPKGLISIGEGYKRSRANIERRNNFYRRLHWALKMEAEFRPDLAFIFHIQEKTRRLGGALAELLWRYSE